MRRSPGLVDSRLSRRSLLEAMTAVPFLATPFALASGRNGGDPIFALYQKWRAADATYEAARVACQELETALLARVAYPSVCVFRKGLPPRRAFVASDIDSLFDESHEDWIRQERLKARLARRQAQWDRESLACGLTTAIEHENAMSFHVDDAVNAVAATPATTIAGVAAKLELAAEIEGVSPQDSLDFPWPYLFSALVDLRRLISTSI
jgi:hypothetical protein